MASEVVGLSPSFCEAGSNFLAEVGVRKEQVHMLSAALVRQDTQTAGECEEFCWERIVFVDLTNRKADTVHLANRIS